MACCRTLGAAATLYVPDVPPALYSGGGAPATSAAPAAPVAATEAAVAAAGAPTAAAATPAAGAALAAAAAPPPAVVGQGAMAWKRFFFDGLWPARHKWGPLVDDDGVRGGGRLGTRR